MTNELMQSGDTREGLEALLSRFRSDLPPDVQADVLRRATNDPDMTSKYLAGLMRDTLDEFDRGAAINLNKQSVNNEAAFLQGGYDPSVANAVSASVGVGVNAQDVEQAAADFALEAARAITNGQPLNEVRTADPNLSLAAQEAIYEQVAQQQGTNSEQIAQKAAAAKAADMQMIQGAVFGFTGGNAQEAKVAAPALTLAAALAGNEGFFASLASMNGGLQEANRGDIGLLTAPSHGQGAQRGNDTGWSLA